MKILREKREYVPGHERDGVQVAGYTRRIPRLPDKAENRDRAIIRAIQEQFGANNPSGAMSVYLSNCDKLSDPRFWEVMRAVWLACRVFPNAEQYFRDLFASKRPRRDWFMTLEDAATMAALPDFFTLYRMARVGALKNALRWTLNRENAVAERAARIKDGAKPEDLVILHQQANRTDLWAYTNRRGEEEVIINRAEWGTDFTGRVNSTERVARGILLHE